MTTIPSQLPTLARHIAEALDRLASNAQREAEASTEAAERAYFKRGAAAYRKALYYHLTGLAPVAAPSGGYLVPSATRGGLVHRVTAAGCSCEAGSKNIVCWHQGLCVGIEAGLEAAGESDDSDGESGARSGTNVCGANGEDADEMDVSGAAPEAHPAGAGSLGERLARARRARDVADVAEWF